MVEEDLPKGKSYLIRRGNVMKKEDIQDCREISMISDVI